MENSSIHDASRANSQREPADDVALLYSWAKIENTAYRDFSRPRTSPSTPLHNGSEKNEAAVLATRDDSIPEAIASSSSHSPVVRDIVAPPTSDGLARQRPGHEI